MASSTPLDPYSIDKSPIVSEITTLKNRDLGPNPVCDRTISLHWGGRFGVRESGEPIPAHLWVIVISTTLEAVDTPRRTTRKATSLSDPPPSPYSPM